MDFIRLCFHSYCRYVRFYKYPRDRDYIYKSGRNAKFIHDIFPEYFTNIFDFATKNKQKTILFHISLFFRINVNIIYILIILFYANCISNL